MVLAGFVGGFGWLWLVLGGFGWFWLVLAGSVPTYQEVTGSNSVEILTFSGFYTQLLKLRS